MIVVVAVLKAKQGKEQEMEDALRWIVPQVENEPGTLQYALHRARKQPGTFLMYEAYRDKDALNAHSATSYFAQLFAKIGDLLDGSPSLEIYEPLSAIKPKS